MFLQTKNARSLCCMTSKNTLTDWWFQLFQTVFVIGDHYPKHADLKTSHQSPAHRNSISPAPAISMVMFHHAKVDMKRKQNKPAIRIYKKGISPTNAESPHISLTNTASFTGKIMVNHQYASKKHEHQQHDQTHHQPHDHDHDHDHDRINVHMYTYIYIRI